MLIVFDIPALKPRDGWNSEMYTFQKFQSHEGRLSGKISNQREIFKLYILFILLPIQI